jgi:hypothetical protein
MKILEEKRRAWMSAVRDHMTLSRDTGKPIPHLIDLLAKLKAARCAYFDEYREANRRENEEWRKRFSVATTSKNLDSDEASSNSVE